MVLVVTRAHEDFYRDDLRDVDDSCVIEQPRNRGTAVAITVALLWILQRDADAIAVFFPCGHYYSDGEAFLSTVRTATAYARQYPESITLLGAEAHYAEVDYGWIEPGQPIVDAPAIPLRRVNRFWEKPSLPEAHALLGRGCLWNTFVTVGRAMALLQLLCTQIPDVVGCMAEALTETGLDFAYRGLSAVDFSRDVLAHQPQRLLVVRDGALEWADLGNPTRVMDTLARNRISPAWAGEVRSAVGWVAREFDA